MGSGMAGWGELTGIDFLNQTLRLTAYPHVTKIHFVGIFMTIKSQNIGL
jgi:hypothetical protein